MSHTIEQSEVIRDEIGRLVVTQIGPGANMVHYLTDCCGASAKGGERGTICRACYHDIDDELGYAWMADDQSAWDDWEGRMGYDSHQMSKSRTIALDHGMPHLSAYCLTVEGKTALAHQVAKGMVIMPEDADQSAQFDRLMERMENADLLHYEISNFALPGHLSRHNTSYWEGVPYLGIGPSAHSYDGNVRRWNVSNNTRYAVALESGTNYSESEILTAVQRTNELLLTGLRTSKGVLLERLELDALAINHRAVVQYKDQGMLHVKDGRLVLTKAGWHFADRIASDLFVSADDRTDRT